jgi:protein-disulfide isomerase
MRAFAALAAVFLAGLLLAASSGGGAWAAGDEIGMGRPDAPVKMVEYASASCPHCARFNNEVFPQFRKKYIDTGVVYYEMRELVTEPVNFAAAAYLTARCAGPDKYYPVLDAVFRAQASMRQTQDYAGGLRTIALGAGLSESQWRACVTDPAAQQALEARIERYTREADIDGTPTFYFNGKKVKSGEMTMAELDAAVAAARAAKK